MTYATDTDAPEVWTSPEGRAAELIYAGQPTLVGTDEDDDGWYPEEAGQLPPRCYELRSTATGATLHALTVFPLAPWSPYDAVADRLLADGWTPPAVEPEPQCVHGMSAWLCAGPGHYPMD